GLAYEQAVQINLEYSECMDARFFFSSRRRHTRSDRDWSSDVCSSDLSWNWNTSPVLRLLIPWSTGSTSRKPSVVPPRAPRTRMRSEERRVGKECRSRRWEYYYKKKTRD